MSKSTEGQSKTSVKIRFYSCINGLSLDKFQYPNKLSLLLSTVKLLPDVMVLLSFF